MSASRSSIVRFLTLILVVAISSSASASPCPELFARLAGQRRESRQVEFWSRYQRALRESTGEVNSDAARASALSRALEISADFSRIHPDFPRADFEHFLRREWGGSLLPMENENWGGFLERAYSQFLQPWQKQADQLARQQAGWREDVRSVFARCGSDWSCIQSEMSPSRIFNTVRERLAGTCLGQSPATARLLANELAMTWGVIGGFYAAKSHGALSEFPFAFAVNGTIWSFILAESDCRGATHVALRVPFGKPLSDISKASWKSQVQAALRQEIDHLKWAPAMAASSIALTVWADHWFERERPEEFYEARFLFLTLYNAATGPVRRLLVIDPVFKKAFPALAEWSRRMVANQKLAEVATRTTEAGVDYGLRWGEWEIWGILYDSFMKAAGQTD